MAALHSFAVPKLRTRGGKFIADCYYVDDNGKRVRRERSTGIVDDGTAQARRTAERAARNIESALAHGEGRRARGTTLRRAYEKLIDRKIVAGRASATLNITAEKGRHVLRYFEGRDAESLTDDDFMAYAQYATMKRAGPTVERELRELSLALKAIGVEPPEMPELAKSKPRERWLKPDERLALLEQIMPRWRDHVVVYMQLGLSKGELGKVLPAHVDLERNTIRVPGTKTRARDRVLPMPADVRTIVQRRLRIVRADEPLFEPWNPGNADRHLRLAAKRAGLGPLSFNDLRRTFATALAREGFTALELRPLMGHASTRMLDQHYARMGLGQDAQHVVDALELTPADERKARSRSARGVPAWNKGKPRRRKYVAETARPEDLSHAKKKGTDDKT